MQGNPGRPYRGCHRPPGILIISFSRAGPAARIFSRSASDRNRCITVPRQAPCFSGGTVMNGGSRLMSYFRSARENRSGIRLSSGVSSSSSGPDASCSALRIIAVTERLIIRSGFSSSSYESFHSPSTGGRESKELSQFSRLWITGVFSTLSC